MKHSSKNTSTDAVVELPRIAILGGGSMARAILAGLLSPQVTVNGTITVTNKSTASSAGFEQEPQVSAVSIEANPHANREAAAQADIVIVAVKPAMVPELLSDIAGSLGDTAVVVSVAAGVSTEKMEAQLPANIAVVRSMPNTPARVGLGVTGVAAGSRVSDAQLDVVVRLFGTVGDVVLVPEKQLDALGAISGSGPAYLFYLVEQFERIARDKGFDSEQAQILVRQTLLGSLELLQATGETPAELRRQVTSPNGTTERAIAVFDDADLHGIFARALDAAIARSEQLARGEN